MSLTSLLSMLTMARWEALQAEAEAVVLLAACLVVAASWAAAVPVVEAEVVLVVVEEAGVDPAAGMSTVVPSTRIT